MPTKSQLLQTIRHLENVAGELNCMVCFTEFDAKINVPICVCPFQHTCCSSCSQTLKKCPLCRARIIQQGMAKNRLMISILQQIDHLKDEINRIEFKQFKTLTQFSYKVDSHVIQQQHIPNPETHLPTMNHSQILSKTRQNKFQIRKVRHSTKQAAIKRPVSQYQVRKI